MLGWIVAASLLGIVLAELLVWAGRHGLALDEQTTGDAVRRQLRRGRVARTLGFLAAFAIGEGASLYWTHLHLPSLLSGPPLPVPFSVLASPSGWAAGYLSAGMLAAERLVAVAVIALGPLALAVRGPLPESWTFLHPGTDAGITDGVVAAVVAGLVEVGL